MYPKEQLEQDIRQLVLEEQGVYLKDRCAFKEFVCRFLVFLAKCTYKRRTHFCYYALDDATLCFSMNKHEKCGVNDNIHEKVKDKMFQRREELVFCLRSEEERKKECISPRDGVSKTLHVPVYLAFVKCSNEKMVKASQDMCMFFFDMVHSKKHVCCVKVQLDEAYTRNPLCPCPYGSCNTTFFNAHYKNTWLQHLAQLYAPWPPAHFEPKSIEIDFFTLNMLHMAAVFGLERFAEGTAAIKKQQIDKMVTEFPHIKRIFADMRSNAVSKRNKYLTAQTHAKTLAKTKTRTHAKTKKAKTKAKRVRREKKPILVLPPSETIDDHREERQHEKEEAEWQRQRDDKRRLGDTLHVTRGMYNHPLFLHTLRCKRCMGHQPCTKREKFEESYNAWKKNGAPAFGWTV